MAIDIENNTNRVKSERHWPYLAVIAVLALALAAAATCIINEQTKLRNELAQIRLVSSNTSKAMNTRQLAQAKALNHLEAVQQQQTAVIYAALGKVIPVKMPVEFDAQLSDAEKAATRLAMHEHPDRVKVKNAISAVATLVRQLPPWAEQNYLPRFNALRWALAAEYLLATSGKENGQTATEASDAAQNLVNQLNSVPNAPKRGITLATLDRLSDQIRSAARAMESRTRLLVYRDARNAALACLAGGAGSPSAALDGLQPWLKDKKRGAQAEFLANKIRPLVAERQAKEIMKELRRASPQLNGSLLAVAAGGAYNQLAGLKISMASLGLASDPVVEADLAKCKAALRQIAAQQAAKRARISRAYQAWAMERIDACEESYKVANGSHFKAILGAAAKGSNSVPTVLEFGLAGAAFKAAMAKSASLAFWRHKALMYAAIKIFAAH